MAVLSLVRVLYEYFTSMPCICSDFKDSLSSSPQRTSELKSEHNFGSVALRSMNQASFHNIIKSLITASFSFAKLLLSGLQSSLWELNETEEGEKTNRHSYDR